MKLVLVIDGRIIDALPLAVERWKDPNYMADQKARLETKHSQQIEERKESSCFFIEGVVSRLNARRK